MRAIFGLSLLALAATSPAMAQPYGPGMPPGDYGPRCTELRMEGQFLSGYCRGSRGSGRSSINVQSCSTGITVDPSGGLACIGPGGGAPPSIRDAPPGFATGEPSPYGRGRDGGWRGGGRGLPMATLYARPGWRGRSIQVAGETPDLGSTRLNDRVRSIRIEGRSGPWSLCTDARYRGRCVTIDRSIPDTRQLGIGDAISSLRPAW